MMRILKGIPKVVLHPSFFPTLIFDCLLQRQLYKISKSRWITHSLFFWGFIGLFFIGSLGNMLTDLGWWSVTKDTPWFALTNELLGVGLIIGFIIVAIRRYVLKEPRLYSGREDLIFYILLMLSILSGFIVEAARLASEGPAYAPGHISFLGYIVSITIQNPYFILHTSYLLVWWFHALVSLTIVAIIPHTKLFHMFMAPLVMLLNRTVFSQQGAEGEPIP